MARVAACLIGSGVGKSGSPTPKEMTGWPCALSALVRASSAIVADAAMPSARLLGLNPRAAGEPISGRRARRAFRARLACQLLLLRSSSGRAAHDRSATLPRYAHAVDRPRPATRAGTRPPRRPHVES